MKIRTAVLVLGGLAGMAGLGLWPALAAGADERSRAEPARTSLYERLGGLPAISIVVSDFICDCSQGCSPGLLWQADFVKKLADHGGSPDERP